MIKTENPSRPRRRVYAVRKVANEESRWTEIGAAWQRQGGKGFNVKLDCLSLNGVETVIREPRAAEVGR
jgi:hypothetical protein